MEKLDTVAEDCNVLIKIPVTKSPKRVPRQGVQTPDQVHLDLNQELDRDRLDQELDRNQLDQELDRNQPDQNQDQLDQDRLEQPDQDQKQADPSHLEENLPEDRLPSQAVNKCNTMLIYSDSILTSILNQKYHQISYNMSNNQMIDYNTVMVNGPVNVLRLEGKIHGINKVIYLFMDFHLNLDEQTQCSNIFSKDVQKYFTDNFYELNDQSQTYDFFVELYPSELADNYDVRTIVKEYKDIYIEEVVKLFRKVFQYDPKRNKAKINKIFSNVRFHYLDIRDYYKNVISQNMYQITEISHKFMKNDGINTGDLSKIIDLMQIMRDHIQYIIDILETNVKSTKQKVIKENISELDTKVIKYLTNKIKKKYVHSDVRDAMHDLIDLSIANFNLTIKEIDNATDRFKTYLKKIRTSSGKLTKDNSSTYLYTYGINVYNIRSMIMDIVNTMDLLVNERFIEFFARFTDIYFLRRFLDKDYITNAIVYSGALHSNTYVNVLVNQFGFKITHTSYSKIKDMTKLTQEVKRRSLMEIQELILPEKLVQCSDLSHFPERFT